MGLLPLYEGMRVRLTQRLARAENLVQDAPGTVVDIEYHEREDLFWMSDTDHPAWSRGYVLLEYMPRAVYVAFDDHIPAVVAATFVVWLCNRAVPATLGLLIPSAHGH